MAAVALLLAGCATAPSGNGGPDPWQALTAGMTADQVRVLLGPPAAVRPMKSSQGPAEIWTYRRLVAAGTNLVATRMQEVAAADPLSGEMTKRLEPEYSQEARNQEEDLQLLVFDGKLVSWKRTGEAKRDYFQQAAGRLRETMAQLEEAAGIDPGSAAAGVRP